MSEEDDWIKTLEVPGITLPALRDLRIQFLALIVFDIMLGPVVYISEINTGSSYIKKLKSFSTLSEVYAGLARSPQHTVSTNEEDIAVFRYDDGSATDITTVFLISCLPESDLEPVREIGQKALFKSKGDPDLMGTELSKTLRESLSIDKKVLIPNKKSPLFYWDEERIVEPLNNSTIKGIAIIDYDGKYVDLRNLPLNVEGRELIPKAFIQFVNNQYASIVPNTSTSLLYQNIPFLATKSKDKDIIVLVQISENKFKIINKIISWLNPYSDLIAQEWKFASPREIRNCLKFFDEIEERNTPKEYILKFATMLIRSERIKPNLGRVDMSEYSAPEFIKEEIWEATQSLDGNDSIIELVNKWDIDIVTLISYLEWAQVHELIVFLQS